MDRSSELEVSVVDGAMWLTMNRPEVYNALSPTMVVDLATEIEQARTRDDVRVVVLTGAGRAFSTGADIGGERAHERFDVASMDAANRWIRAIVGLDKPVVAAVNGIAAGVSCSAALVCDLVVARESASFLLPFTRVGLLPDGGATATVAGAIGRSRAMRMALLAEPLPAPEALAAGLISHVAGDEDYADVLADVVRRLVAGPPLAVAATKKAVNAATLTGLEDALERERLSQTVLFRTADLAEGMAAFSGRRPPVFRGQ